MKKNIHTAPIVALSIALALAALVLLAPPARVQDKKITEVTALTSATTDDVMPIVDAPGTSPASRKITAGNLATSFSGFTTTLTNHTFAASNNTLGGVTMGLGSDATGDIYYRNSGGQLARLGVGTNGQALVLASGLPSWASLSGLTPGGSAGGDLTGSYPSPTITTDAVTYAKMQNVSAASKLIGRGDSGAGDPQEITLGTGLSMSGTTLSASGGGVLTSAELIGHRLMWTKIAESNGNSSLHGVTNLTGAGGGTDYRDALGVFNLYFTSSAALHTAGVFPNSAGNYKQARVDWNPIFEAFVRTDSSATEISNTNGRWWIGLFSADPSASATPAVHGCGFRVDNAVDGTTVKAWCDNGSGTPTVVSTGVTWAASTAYKLKYFLTGSSATFYIDGSLVATITTTLPSSGTDLGIFAAATQVASGAGDARKHIGINRLYVTQLY